MGWRPSPGRVRLFMHGEGSGPGGPRCAWGPPPAVRGLWLAAQSPPSATASARGVGPRQAPHGVSLAFRLVDGRPWLHLLAEVPAGVFVPASSSSLAGTHGAAVAWQDGTGRPCPPGTCRRVARHTRQGPGRAGPWASSGGRADRGAALQTGSTSRGRGRGRPRCCPCST